ncbi:superoxide dismutase [Cu-Zn] precursor [Vibrio ponticus]|nr:superoxide dismutase [Cu-Zn] precursor [Vibrio ponticus]
MKHTLLLAALCLASTSALASELKVEMIELASGNSAGTITISENQYGTVFTPKLQGLSEGIHGFHVHTNLRVTA